MIHITFRSISSFRFKYGMELWLDVLTIVITRCALLILHYNCYNYERKAPYNTRIIYSAEVCPVRNTVLILLSRILLLYTVYYVWHVSAITRLRRRPQLCNSLPPLPAHRRYYRPYIIRRFNYYIIFSPKIHIYYCTLYYYFIFVNKICTIILLCGTVRIMIMFCIPYDTNIKKNYYAISGDVISVDTICLSV